MRGRSCCSRSSERQVKQLLTRAEIKSKTRARGRGLLRNSRGSVKQNRGKRTKYAVEGCGIQSHGRSSVFLPISFHPPLRACLMTSHRPLPLPAPPPLIRFTVSRLTDGSSCRPSPTFQLRCSVKIDFYPACNSAPQQQASTQAEKSSSGKRVPDCKLTNPRNL